jgi:enediyne polyketide synthase
MSIAIVAIACRYPDANDAAALWRNVLEGRRAFRAIPPERLDLARYAADLVGEAESITKVKAGLLADWQFNRSHFRISKPLFERTDLTHWLALEVAAEAIESVGGAEGFDRNNTAVIVGNTLTGEFSRAATLRMRTPFLDDLLTTAISGAGLDRVRSMDLRRGFFAALRERFPEPGEDTLAGGLANTIASRVANFFDLHGGAYTVDAACASSLVALANALDLLSSGAVSTAIVGAVDLSIDPFELIGFSRNGALAAGEMRVFDARATGFWPGEGAGFAVLMHEGEARRRGLPILAVIRGWGISTDGAGGLTRPDAGGQILALQRAYERANVDSSDVGYLEAHGTGTAVGDPVEVRAVATLRNGARRALPIGSIKANIGHTKAAAGFAGLIKTISALGAGIIPPHVSCTTEHPVFGEVEHRVRPALVPEAWPENEARIAGVSAFGFGGINAHLVLEGGGSHAAAVVLPARPRVQDAELFAFAGTAENLPTQLRALAARASTLTLAELADTAGAVARRLAEGPVRCAIVAGEPEELGRKLEQAARAIEAGIEQLDPDEGIYVASHRTAKIGFLFPGQAAPSQPGGGAWARRFDDVGYPLSSLPPDAGADPAATRIAQPTIAAASLAAWRILRSCGIEAVGACGHSLGELSALCWAGAIDEDALVRLASTRGAIMADHCRTPGGMLRIAAPVADAHRLIEGLPLVIACFNAADETVVAGPLVDVRRAELRARERDLTATPLAVSHAFHSVLMAPAVPLFARALGGFALSRPQRAVWSTVSGNALRTTDELVAMLTRQIVAPVQFEQALHALAAEVGFFIEVGPGTGLTRLARKAGLAAISVDAFGQSLRPLLGAIGYVFAAAGQPVNFGPLFDDRSIRPVDLMASPRFLGNPCGRRNGDAAPLAPVQITAPEPASPIDDKPDVAADDVLNIVRGVLANETGLAPGDVRDHDRFLDNLHLNSIAVGRVVTKAARLIGIRTPDSPSEFANATISELAAGLIALRDLVPQSESAWERVPGVRPWVRTFEVRWTDRQAAPRGMRSVRWKTAVIAGSAEDREVAAQSAGRAQGDAASDDGLLIWIGVGADVQSTYELFAACRSVWSDSPIKHLAICHAGTPVAAFARSLALEDRFSSILVVERSGPTQSVGTELSRDIEGFYEVRIGPDGLVSEPYFALTQPASRADAVLNTNDVVLVTGGAKGIGAECALRLAARTGAALVFAGRSAPDDPAVATTLKRAAAAGLRCRYVPADVTDKQALTAAVAEAAQELGPITALMHVAGINEPQLFQDIDDAALRRLLAPKTSGLFAAVAAAGSHLRRVITFGSILGRMGLKGEAHYAIANAWQSKIAEEIASSRPQCHLLSLEWSIWNGAGMGHRLGSLERLARYGVDAIALDDGVDEFERLVMSGAIGTMMVTSRFGPPSYVSLGGVELPMLRFLDTAILHYPNLELVVETELSQGRDPYLADHRIDGSAVLPAVIGLEAMAQVASALMHRQVARQIEAIAFRQAIVVPDRRTKRVKIIALAAGDDRVEVAIRGEDDSFAGDCMRATFRFGEALQPDKPAAIDQRATTTRIDARPLYGPLFFQGEHYQHIEAYSHLSARRIAATLRAAQRRDFFASFEPQGFVLGNPGVRDALLHALQAAVPNRRVVPVSVDRIELYGEGPRVRVEGLEMYATADTFTFDIYACDADGAIVEYWQGATFRAIAEIAVDAAIAAVPEITGPYVERVARATTEDASIEVALIASRDANMEERRARALSALDVDGRVLERSDGKPLLTGNDAGLHLSIAHCRDMTLAVKAAGEIGCDLETIVNGAPHKAPMPLSSRGQSLAAELFASGSEQWPTAATRVWALHEVAIKQNRPLDLPCTIHRSRRDKVVTFETAFGCTTTIHVSGLTDEFIVAIGTRSAAESLR